MNRKEFMEKLERLLTGIPVDEREEALQYYTDYFEDAGVEHEAEVISELGSPEKVAATIKADLKGGSSDNGEFTENGYSDSRFEKRENPATRESTYKKAEGGYSYRSTTENDSYGSSSYSDYEDGSEKPRTSKTLKIILVILIGLVVIPFAFPVLIGIVALCSIWAVCRSCCGFRCTHACRRCDFCIWPVQTAGCIAYGTFNMWFRFDYLCTGTHCYRSNCKTLHGYLPGYVQNNCKYLPLAISQKGGVLNYEKRVEDILDRMCVNRRNRTGAVCYRRRNGSDSFWNRRGICRRPLVSLG